MGENIDSAEINVKSSIGDFSSPTVMRENGWQIEAAFENYPKYSSWCGNTTWFGYNYGASVGSISTTFLGNGNATLNFENCYHSGHSHSYHPFT